MQSIPPPRRRARHGAEPVATPRLLVLGALGIGAGLAIPWLFSADDSWRPSVWPTVSVALDYTTPTMSVIDAVLDFDPTATPTDEPYYTPTPPPEAFIAVLPTIDAAMKGRLRAVHLAGLARGMRPNVFIKVGDSITASGYFLTDFGCGIFNLGAHAELAPAIDYFRSVILPDTLVQGPNFARCPIHNSFTRQSLAAGIGWSAIHVYAPFESLEARATREAEAALAATDGISGTVPGALAPDTQVAASGSVATTRPVVGTGAPEAPATFTEVPEPKFVPPPECAPPDDTPLRCELKLMQPGLALIMFGTNDLAARIPPGDFKAAMDRIVSDLLEAGVIPIVSTIPPRTDRNSANARVSSYNMAVVELARERQVPLLNFWAALQGESMVGRGMAADGIHPQGFGYGSNLSERGLRYGQNQRNLYTLLLLEKIKRIVIDDGAAEG